MPAEAYLEWKDWAAEDFGRFTADEAVYFASELDASSVPSVKGLRIAEIGYGNGAFAGWVRHNGGSWTGRELSAELYARATAKGYTAVKSTENLCIHADAPCFDLLVAFDVLEHLDISSITALLREASQILATNGLAIFRLPSGDSPFSGAIYNGDLSHKTLLGSKAITWLAMENGFSVRQVREPVLPIRGATLTKAARRIAVRIFRRPAFAFIQTVLMGNSSAVVSPNMLVVLQKRG